jgi:hypothetical protein
MTEEIPKEQAERIGKLYTEALKNYDDFGKFQLAFGNCTTHKAHERDVDNFERALKAMIEFDASTSTPREENGHWEEWDEYINSLD